MLMYRRLRI